MKKLPFLIFPALRVMAINLVVVNAMDVYFICASYFRPQVFKNFKTLSAASVWRQKFYNNTLGLIIKSITYFFSAIVAFLMICLPDLSDK